ncbi:hypothetical protein RJ639_008828 [Escallonia herrerae]|uniref:Uncharacterized protein n=1 Tax=Escallonia herrerae TaxID=1293975 RepID=A0AA89ATC8_9ASTE|nr:hypothetical protein RJ639_008828 [Escallonia herrerae]
MEDTDPYITKYQQSLAPQVPLNHANPSKFYTQFLYKAVIVSVFLALVPLFPSQAPEFINQTLHNRSWELIQLVFVGIAVSYGLFSKRNDETEKEHGSKFDNAQSYVSRLLQVSSVFDDETENPSVSDENKIQTWSSQYYRGEPVVVVAPETSVLDENRGASSLVEKPLLLPIRSLKTPVSNPDLAESMNESSCINGSLSRSSSKSGSKRLSRNSTKSRSGEFVGASPPELKEKVEENVVLRSPIPWRSRSGRMEMKEDVDNPPLYSLPPSMENSEFNRLESRSFRSQSSKSSRSNSTSPSPKILSHSPSLSSELQAKSVEDTVRKKTYHKSSTPPPPPPPPPSFIRKSPLVKSSLSATYDEGLLEKELKRSVRSVPKELNGRSDREELLNRANPETEWTRTYSNGSLTRKSVRTIRPGEPPMGTEKSRSFNEDFLNELEANFKERKGHTPVSPKEKKKEIMEEVAVETDEDSESEDYDDFEENPVNEEVASNSVSDGGPDVNKKADEFIAKFREQIRLQRIASIRKSTGQLPRNSLR